LPVVVDEVHHCDAPLLLLVNEVVHFAQVLHKTVGGLSCILVKCGLNPFDFPLCLFEHLLFAHHTE
jgi:hypothetical protein